MKDDSRLALVVDGRAISALVVGGGHVASRKVRRLLDAGVKVRVIARTVRPELEALARVESRLELSVGEVDGMAFDSAMLVVAATDDPALNAEVARRASGEGRLVIAADDADAGSCIMPAVHRAGPLLVAVTAGGLPGAAARVRDEIATRFDGRYAAAMSALRSLRRQFLTRGDRERWHEAAADLLGAEFCSSVERGTLEERMTAWR